MAATRRRQLKVEMLLGEIHAQASMALNAGEFLSNPDEGASASQRWLMFQAFLSHAAAVSRILNPVHRSGRDQDVVDELRQHVRYNTLELLADRHVRDSVEHVDERLETWADSAAPFGPLDWMWAPDFVVNIAEPLKSNRLRTFSGPSIVVLNREGTDVDVLPWREMIDELTVVAVRTWGWRVSGAPSLPVSGENPSSDDVAEQYSV